MSNAVSSGMGSDRGFSTPGPRPDYKNYRSPYGPKYTIQSNFHGITALTVRRFAFGMGMFGGVAGFAALFFLADVPRVREDIMQKIPILGPYWVRKVAPEDNPF